MMPLMEVRSIPGMLAGDKKRKGEEGKRTLIPGFRIATLKPLFEHVLVRAIGTRAD